MAYEEKIIWKSYPDYPFIEANQFGEVRTKDRYIKCKNGRKRLIKGHELKQHDNGHGYKFVSFNVDGKEVHLYTHRIVSVLFVPNPFGLPEVNHLDNNPGNNIFSNLQWCTHQENMDYKEKFGTSALKVSGCPVFAVNLKTLEVLYFESQAEASRQLGISSGNINNIIKGKSLQAKGFWFTEDKNQITKEKIQEIKDKMLFLGGVIAVNSSTLKVLRFKSQAEAERKLNISNQYINDVVKGRARMAKGYCFCHADKNAIENVRAIFGDDVANKVKKVNEK